VRINEGFTEKHNEPLWERNLK